MTEPQIETLRRKLHDAIEEIVTGTNYGPDGGGVLLDCVVVMGWMRPNSCNGVSWIGSGASWASEGLLRRALDIIQRDLGEDEDEEDDDA